MKTANITISATKEVDDEVNIDDLADDIKSKGLAAKDGVDIDHVYISCGLVDACA